MPDYKVCLENFAAENDIAISEFPLIPEHGTVKEYVVNLDFMMGPGTPVYLKVHDTSSGEHIGYSHIHCYLDQGDIYLQAIKSILGCTLTFPACVDYRKLDVVKTLDDFVARYSQRKETNK